MHSWLSIHNVFKFQTKPVASNVYMDTLRNLKLNEVYEIQVIAVASSGASQPSLPILIGTRGNVLNYKFLGKFYMLLFVDTYILS